MFDLGVGLMAAAPLALIATLWPRRAPRSAGWVLSAQLLPVTAFMVFVTFSEFTFWNEFASRFNFIAVDYLIYTNELIGNIRESYNLPVRLSAAAALTLLIWWPLSSQVRSLLNDNAHWARGGLGPCWLLASVLAWGCWTAATKSFPTTRRSMSWRAMATSISGMP